MKNKLWGLLTAVTLAITLPQTTLAQGTGSSADLEPMFIVSTLIYGFIGLGLYVLGYIMFDKLFKLDLRRELVEDQNIAIGIMMAGVFVGIAILIAAVIG